MTTAPNTSSGCRSAESVQITDRDLQLLGFVAAHRFVLAAQVRSYLGASTAVTYRRLHALKCAGLLSYRQVFANRHGAFSVTAVGLAVIESELPRPVIDLRTYRHDVGVGWLWLAAHQGRFGRAGVILTEREMRSRDQRCGRGELFAIPVDGYTSRGAPRVHYPDVLVSREAGSSVALELELTLKSRRRLEAIIAGYAADPRISAVVYVTDSEVVASAVEGLVLVFGLDAVVRLVYLERVCGRAWGWRWEKPEAREIKR